MLDVKKDEIYTILALILSLIAILQTRKQIKQNKKENLFEKRIKAFFVCQKLIHFYERKEYLFQREFLSYKKFEIIYEEIQEHLDLKEEKDIEAIKKTLEELPFLFPKDYISSLQNFCYIFIFLIQQLFYAHTFLEKIDKIKKGQEEELQYLEEYFLNHTFLPSWWKCKDDFKKTYQYIKKKKIMKKLARQIK